MLKETDKKHIRDQATKMLKLHFLKKDGKHERRILVMAQLLYWFDIFYTQEYKIKIIKKTFTRSVKLKLSNLHRVIKKDGFQRFIMIHGGLDLPTSLMRSDGVMIPAPIHSKNIRERITGVFTDSGDSFQFTVGMEDAYALISMDGLFSFTVN